MARIAARAALVSFIAAVVCHVGFVFGVDLSLGYWKPLSYGLLLVVPLAIISARVAGPAERDGQGLEVAAERPPWLSYLDASVWTYAIGSALLASLGALGGTHSLRAQSSVVMLFCFGAWRIADGVVTRAKVWQGRECEQGHEMPGTAVMCEDCGSPARMSQVLPKRMV